MRTYIDKLVWLISVFMMVSLFLSCGGNPQEVAIEKAIEEQAAAEGRNVDVDIDGGRFSVETEDGSYVADGESVEMTAKDGQFKMALGDKATVPADFPKDVPVYPGAKVTMSMSDAESSSMSLQLETPDSVDRVAEFLKSELPAQGWTNDTEIKTGGDSPMQMLGYKKDNRTVQFMIQGTGTATQLSVTIASEGTEPSVTEEELAPEEPATGQ